MQTICEGKSSSWHIVSENHFGQVNLSICCGDYRRAELIPEGLNNGKAKTITLTAYGYLDRLTKAEIFEIRPLVERFAKGRYLKPVRIHL